MTRRAMGRRLRALAFAGALGLAGCDADSASSSFQSEPVLAATASDGELLSKIQSAPHRARYRGTREVLQVHADGSETRYREDVAGDGTGRFALELDQWLDPPLAGLEAALTAELFAARAGLAYRYRGFAIRHLPTFLANFYAVEVAGPVPVVAGIEGVRLDVEPRDPAAADRRWELVVEPDTGLLLEVRELVGPQTLVARTRFETLDLDPSFEGVAWHFSGNEEVSVPPGKAAQAFDWPLLEPVLLPAGYQATALARVSAAGTTWAKRTYTNGVDVLFFLEREPLPADGADAGLGAATTEPGDVVQSYAIEAWTVLEGEVDGHRLIALGRVPELELAMLLQSAIE